MNTTQPQQGIIKGPRYIFGVLGNKLKAGACWERYGDSLFYEGIWAGRENFRF